MTTASSAVDDLERAARGAEQLVEGVQRGQWELPTPCTEWNVRELVNHMCVGAVVFAAMARGERQGPPTPEDRARDNLGEDPAGGFRSAVEGLIDALRMPGALERRYMTPVGEQDSSGVARMRTIELLVHGWDLTKPAPDGAPAVDRLAAFLGRPL